jgi:hypothetical protein
MPLVMALTVVAASSLLGACKPSGDTAPSSASTPTAVAATPAQAKLEVVGNDFPELIVYASENAAAAASQTPADPCAGVRAARLAELKNGWPAAIEQIAFECGRDSDNPDEETPNTTAVATLRDGAVTMHGLPVIEIRVSASGYGDERRYILAGSFAQHGKTLLAKIMDSCRARPMPCEPPAGDDSFYLQTSEIGGIRIEQDETDPQRIVYSEVQGE